MWGTLAVNGLSYHVPMQFCYIEGWDVTSAIQLGGLPKMYISVVLVIIITAFREILYKLMKYECQEKDVASMQTQMDIT
jgi:hypothetical protein